MTELQKLKPDRIPSISGLLSIFEISGVFEINGHEATVFEMTSIAENTSGLRNTLFPA